ncbi:hypothetical protein JCM3775_001026 [Rhodotorula graminis]
MQQRPADAQASSRSLPRDAGLEANAPVERPVDTASTRSGRSASSHRSARPPAPSANDQATLPALPDELLAALSRAPPGEVGPSASASSQAHGRASLALDIDRPTFLHPSPPTLPDVPPQSPFGLAYAYPLASSSSSSSAHASPTTPRPPPQSPGATPTAPLGGFSSNRTAAAVPSPPLDAPSCSPAPPQQRRSPAPSPPISRTLPSVSPSKRNVFKAFSFGRTTRPPHPPLPGAPASSEFAVPPNLSPPASASSGESRPPSQWSRIANAPPALATTSAPPISAGASSSPSPSSSSPFPSSRARSAVPPTALPALERTRTGSSATTAPSLDTDGDDGGGSGEADELSRRWSARPGTAAEQFTRDLRGARRESVRALGGAQHGEVEEDDEERLVYDDEADEDEGEGDEALGPRGDEAALGRRASTMSLRHQLAAFPQVEDHPLPLSSLPVHVEGGDDDGPAERLSKLDLDGVSAEREASFASSAHEPELEQRSPVSSADFIVAVVGPRSAGKSTVIRRGLKRPPSAPVVLQEDAEGSRVTTSTTSFSISGARRTIEVLEIDMGCLRYSDEGVVWPDGLPQCEGAMLCYDSTDPDSLDSLSLLLKAFWTRGSDVPLIVLACKAAPPTTDSSAAGMNATDPKAAAAVCNVYGAGIVTLDGGLDDPQRKTKECFNWLIRQIMDNRGELVRPASVASATATASTSSPTTSRRGSLRTATPLAWATTSSSPITSRPPPTGPLPDPPSTPHGPRSSRLVRSGSASLGLSVVEEAPLGTSTSMSSSNVPAGDGNEPDYEAEAQAVVSAMLASVAADEDDDGPHAPSSPVPRRPSAPVEPGSAAPTYRSEAPSYRSRQEEKEGSEREKDQFHAGVVPYPPPAAVERRGSTKPQSLDLFFKRDDLVDKFLFASVAGNDEQFVTLFLITFRQFARPHDVLEKLVERFHFVAGKMANDPLLCRFGQMKLCSVLSTWMQNYPGDFAAPATFDLVERFLESLLPSGATWVAHYAFELVPLLPSIAKLVDPEAGWALPDKAHVDPAFSPPRPPPAPRPAAPPMSRRGSLAPSYDSTSSVTHDAPNTSPSASRLSVPGSVDNPGEPSASLGFGLGASMQRTTSDTGTDGSSSILARNGVPSSAVLVDLSNAVVEMREQDVATQITRIAWDIFGGMSPRDLLRHVLAPRDPHNPEVALRDSTSPVARSINFVNHLASWTATLILVQSKVKARARVVEKLLLVAVALREQENFDSLMGVLAGLNSQPIFRLTETMELVTTKLDGDPRAQPHRMAQPDGDKNRLPKKLRSLNRLMAASKSFAAYRLALANSGINMIPYLGVHLQDLTVTNEMKSDMRGGNVNWSKMSQLGKSAAVVLDCARVAPKLAVDRTIERCILNAPVLDEDRQYALSYAHQPRQNGKSGARARLREFAKSTF